MAAGTLSRRTLGGALAWRRQASILIGREPARIDPRRHFSTAMRLHRGRHRRPGPGQVSVWKPLRVWDDERRGEPRHAGERLLVLLLFWGGLAGSIAIWWFGAGSVAWDEIDELVIGSYRLVAPPEYVAQLDDLLAAGG